MDFMHFMSILSKICILFNSVLPIKILKSYIHIHIYMKVIIMMLFFKALGSDLILFYKVLHWSIVD